MKQSLSMNTEEFQLMNEVLSDNFGIIFPEHKMSIIESKLKPRITELKMNSFMDYYLYLQFNLNGEKKLLATLVTNNETYFFRETYQFEAMLEHALEDMKSQSVVPNSLRFLSAGCSSGEEPYTLNIFLKENQYRMWGYRIDIEAFDIDIERLIIARSGEYTHSSMRGVEPEKIHKYFIQTDEGLYRLKQMYREGVTFCESNIYNVNTFRRMMPYDAIFCRNVLIYFCEAALHKAVDNFAQVLRPGGLLFLGHSESIIGLSKHFETVRIGNCIAYKKVSN